MTGLGKRLRPLGDRVLVAPIERAKLTDSGLHLSEDWKPEQTGTIVTVGSAVREVEPGDVVAFSWNVGQELRFFESGEERRFFMMHESNLLAIIEKERIEWPTNKSA